MAECVRALASASRWTAPAYLGRVFLLGGIPKDGLPARILRRSRRSSRAEPLEPRLSVEAEPAGAGHGWAEFTVKSTNTGPTPTDLSHFNSWIQLRVEGGTVASVRPGDFDRYEQLTSEAEGLRPTSSSRAVVCRLFENLFAPGEVDRVGTDPRRRRASARLRELAPDRAGRQGHQGHGGRGVRVAAAASPRRRPRGDARERSGPRLSSSSASRTARSAPARRRWSAASVRRTRRPGGVDSEDERLVAPGRFHGTREVLGVDDVERALLRAGTRRGRTAAAGASAARRSSSLQEVAVEDARARREDPERERPAEERGDVLRDAALEGVRVGAAPRS